MLPWLIINYGGSFKKKKKKTMVVEFRAIRVKGFCGK
jgi:hypothetical protein